jgi:hypothetical protein
MRIVQVRRNRLQAAEKRENIQIRLPCRTPTPTVED